MTATTTPGNSTSTRQVGRWGRRPSGGIRLLAGSGPPVAVAVTFLLGWVTVSEWPEAETYGDTSFVWMPAGAIFVCGGAALAGLAVLAASTARQVMTYAVLFWLGAAWLYPAAFVSDGFPQSAKPLMTGLSIVSLLPTVVVWWWAALGRVEPPPPVRTIGRVEPPSPPVRTIPRRDRGPSHGAPPTGRGPSPPPQAPRPPEARSGGEHG